MPHWILEGRAKLNLTQAALAAQVGVSQALISMWENEKVAVPEERVSELAQLFSKEDVPEGDNPDVPELGQRVAEVRRQARLSITQLAEKSGLTYQTIRNIERGAVSTPRADTLARINGALGGLLEENLPAEEIRAEPGQSAVHGIGNMVDVSDPSEPGEWSDGSGIYVLFNEEKCPVYIGRTTRSLRARVSEHFHKFWFKPPVVQTGGYFEIADEELCRQVEKALIRTVGRAFLINRYERLPRDEKSA